MVFAQLLMNAVPRIAGSRMVSVTCNFRTSYIKIQDPAHGISKLQRVMEDAATLQCGE
jgi:hypothetical protein